MSYTVKILLQEAVGVYQTQLCKKLPKSIALLGKQRL
jgi:hypothetical protein